MPPGHPRESMGQGRTIREGDAPVHYLVGTPKGRLTKLEKSFLGKPWQAVRPCVEVKLFAEEGELYILVHSESRVLKERSMRKRRLKKLWQRLHELRRQSNRRDQLLLKLGSAKKEAGRAWRLVDIRVPQNGKPVTPENVHLRPAPRPATPSAPTRRPLPVALQHDRGRPRDAMEILHAAHRDRAGVQGTQA